MPYIKRIRNQLLSKNYKEEDLFAVGYLDEALPQLKNVTHESLVKDFNDEKITINKQNPARSHCEQPCDLGKLFMISRKKQKSKMALGSRDRSDVYHHKVKTGLNNV